MTENEPKRAIRAAGIVAAALVLAACGGLHGVMPDEAASGRANLIEQPDDVQFVTTDLHHFAVYNNFRMIAEAPAGARVGSPFISNAEARNKLWWLGGGNEPERLMCSVNGSDY